MRTVVHDAGALVAAERNDRRLWAEHRIRLEAGVVPVVPAPVVAQVSRSPRQGPLRRLLRGCDVLSLDEPMAHAVGQLLGRSRTIDIADATVVTVATTRRGQIVTGDRHDLARLAGAAGALTAVPLRPHGRGRQWRSSHGARLDR